MTNGQRRRIRRFPLAGLLACFVQAGCGHDPVTPHAKVEQADTQIEVVTQAATRKAVRQTLELTGNLLPRRRSLIVAEVDGVVESIPKPINPLDVSAEQLEFIRSLGIDPSKESLTLDIGDAVPKGGVLVRLKKRDFELALTAAVSRHQAAQTELQKLLAWRRQEDIERLTAMRDETLARQTQKAADLRRAETLAGQNAISTADYEQAKLAYAAAAAAHRRAVADLKIATTGPTKEEIDVVKAAVAEAAATVEIRREALTKAVIYAPYDAVVTDRYVDVGDRVTALPRVEIMEVMDVSVALAQVGIPERFLHRVQMGNRAFVRVKGERYAVEGMIVRMNDKVDPETRTFRVRVAVDNQQRRLKPGQFVVVDFEIASSEDTVAVPSKAVVHAGGQTRVFVVEQGLAVSRPVTIGLSGGGLTEVTLGLKDGDRVITDDPTVLAGGMPVRERVKQTAPADVDAVDLRGRP